MVDGYTALYNTTQLQWAVTDVIGGLFSGIAGMAQTYGLAIIALAIVATLFVILGKMNAKM